MVLRFRLYYMWKRGSIPLPGRFGCKYHYSGLNMMHLSRCSDKALHVAMSVEKHQGRPGAQMWHKLVRNWQANLFGPLQGYMNGQPQPVLSVLRDESCHPSRGL